MILLLASAAPARAGEPLPDLSPLGLRTQGTLRELFLDVVGQDARPSQQLALDVRYSLANDWGMPTTLHRGDATVVQLLDEQADSISISARLPWARLLGPGPRIGARPLWERLSTTVEWRATLHWGGISDAAIETWHDVSGAFNFERAMYPRNEIHLYLGNEAHTAYAFDLSSPTLALGDLVLRNQLTLFEGGLSAGPLTPQGELRPAWAVALRLDAKVPLGSLAKLGGSGGWDAAAGLSATGELMHWLTAHALVAVTAASTWDSSIPLATKPWSATAELSLAAAIGGWAVFVEDRVRSPLLMPGWTREEASGNDGYLASTYAADFRPHNQLSFGLRRKSISVWMSEDFTPGSNPRSTLHWLYNSNAPDIVIGVAWSKEL
jgi:hypothetical protein